MFKIYNDDCIKWMHEAKKRGEQFDLSVFSPPFSSFILVILFHLSSFIRR